MKIASKCKVKKTWAVQLQSRTKGYLDMISWLLSDKTTRHIRAPEGEPDDLI